MSKLQPLVGQLKAALTDLPDTNSLVNCIAEQWQFDIVSAAIEAKDSEALPASLTRRSTRDGEVDFDRASELFDDQFDLAALGMFLEKELKVAVAARDLRDDFEREGGSSAATAQQEHRLLGAVTRLMEVMDSKPEVETFDGRVLRKFARTTAEELSAARDESLRFLERYQRGVEESKPILPSWAGPLQKAIEGVTLAIGAFDAKKAFTDELPKLWKVENDPRSDEVIARPAVDNSLPAAIKLLGAVKSLKAVKLAIESDSLDLPMIPNRLFHALDAYLDTLEMDAADEGGDLRHLKAVGRERLERYEESLEILKGALRSTSVWLTPIAPKDSKGEVATPEALIPQRSQATPPQIESDLCAVASELDGSKGKALRALIDRYGTDPVFYALDSLSSNGAIKGEVAAVILDLLVDVGETPKTAPTRSKTMALTEAKAEIEGLGLDPELVFRIFTAVRSNESIGRAGLLPRLLGADRSQSKSTLDRVFDKLEEEKLLKREGTGGRGKSRSGRYILPNTSNGIRKNYPATFELIDGLKSDPDYLE